jgi:hypothetical protein
MKNITLSADEKAIEAAREGVRGRGSTLNEEFRRWLPTLADTPEQRSKRYRALMKRLDYVNAGRKFSRQELNDRYGQFD